MVIPLGVIGTVVQANSGPPLGDPYWNNVMLLANFTNGPYNSTNIDASGNITSATTSGATFSLASGTPVSANHGQYLSKTGASSGNYRIQLGDDTSWAGAFTIEFWMYITGYRGSPNGGLMTKSNSTNANTCPFQIYWLGDTLSFRVGYTTDYGEVSKTISKNSLLNVWKHVAFTRDSSGWLRMFVDGVFQSKSLSANTSPTYSNNLPIFIYDWAGASSNGWYGAIDDFRITRDVCRYGSDSDFDLPTEPFWHPEA